MPEIDEAELLRLRRLESTVGAMYKSDASKRKLLEALKEVRPEDPAVKELDKPDPIQAGFEELRQSNAALKKQIEDDKAEREKNAKLDEFNRKQDAGFAKLRAERWTEEGIAKVKAVMQEEGIADVAIAANWIESQMPRQDPITPGGSGAWNFMDSVSTDPVDADLKRLIDAKGENDPLLRKMAGEAINEVRGITGTRR